MRRLSIAALSVLLALSLLTGIFLLTAAPATPGDGAVFAPAAPALTSDAADGGPVTARPSGTPAGDAEELRGVWVCSVYNLDYPSRPGLSADALKREALAILDNCVDIGFNAVFFQVRPTGDALYPSEIFPWSDYLTGVQGQAPEGDFDPLAFWVEEAHKRGLQLHAWVNPFRVTKGSAASPQQDVTQLAESNPARKNPAWTVKYPDGGLYYNPGLPEVRRLVINGVSELARRYAVDGIHYDDYFYPGADFADDQAYRAYGGGFANKNDWRRDCVNQLIRDTQTAVHEIRPGCQFGVSPAGVWANKANNPYGSDTRGEETYSVHCADARKWVTSEWVDYICPQIYWQIGYAAADYQTLLYWWSDVARGTSVKLYVGQAAYRVGTGGAPGDVWYGPDEIIRQHALNAAVPEVAGTVQFRYGSFVEQPALYAAVKALFKPASDASPAAAVTMPVSGVGALAVGRPASDISTSLKNWYILGVSDPSQTLYLNGKPVAGRSVRGFFGVYVELKTGANTFTFIQDGVSVTRIITRKTVSSSPEKMGAAEIPEKSVYPLSGDEYRRPGETVTLKCSAPVGAKVTVKLAGKTYTMTPATKTAPAGGYYATTYTYAYTLPAQQVSGQVILLGRPEYTMTLDGKTSVRTARAIQCVTPGAPYFAEVKSAWAFVYPNAATSGGPSGELCLGQRDYVTGVTGDGAWVRLGLGGWIPASDVRCEMGAGALSNRLESAEYRTDDARWDSLVLSGSALTATKTAYDGKTLTLTVASAAAAPAPALPADTPFSGLKSALQDGKAVYTLTLRAGQTIDGYYVTAEAGRLTLRVKKHPTAAAGSKPLLGFTILLDPGHGGAESGALSPLSSLPEKTVNLYTALKVKKELEALGASVLLTRSEDVTVTLAQRVEASRALRPDLFLSIHGNSVDDDTDASNIYGISSWYRETVSKSCAESLYQSARTALGRGARRANQSNLYVCRPCWTPSVILETGFLCNPAEADWMADNRAQNDLAAAIAQAVAGYFGA